MAVNLQDRLLDFQPITHSPRTLSTAQVQFYNEQGYLLPFDIFDEGEARQNRDDFDAILQAVKQANDGRDSYAINGYHRCCRSIYDLAMTPKILDLVEDIVGPNVICWGTHFFCKLPGDPKSVAWHQDASYWPLEPARTVTVWLAIDDADIANACMHVIPATHNKGHLPWKETQRPAVLNQELTGIEELGEPVAFELKAGQVSMHADMLAHGSGPNTSDRRRCGLTLRYCPPEVRDTQGSGWRTNSIVCRGEDVSGQWGNIPRPEDDTVPQTQDAKPKSIGGN